MKIFKISDFLNEGLEFNQYKTSLSKDEYENILETNCKNFDFSDNKLIRGDSKMGGDYYILNPKYRKVNWDRRRMCSIHLEFLRSDLWDGLPKKVESIDFGFEGNTHIKSGFYGRVYRVIPFDNSNFCMVNNLVGNRNEILNGDLNEQFLSRILDNFANFNSFYNERTNDMIELSNNLNILFKDKEKILNSGTKKKFSYVDDKYITTRSGVDTRMLLKLYEILNSRNMDFIEYMKDAFGPEQYDILNYQEMINSDFDFGWTGDPVLIVKV